MRNYTHSPKFCSLLIFILLALAAKAQLKADFSGDVLKGCSPLVVQFSDKSSGNPTQWEWDLGNGTKSDKQAPSAVFLNAGTGTATYTIKLLVKGAGGSDSVVKQQYISVYANPQVLFTSDITQGCSPLAVRFTDASTTGSGTISNWLWDFGEGTVSTEKNPAHTYTLPNNYTVSLTAGNSVGCTQTYTWENYIQVADTVKADFDYNYTNVCQSPAPVRFTNHSASASAIASYQWTFGDGQSSAENSPGHTYNTIGSYTVQLIATNNNGCKDTISKSLAIGKVGADFTFTNGCTNSAVTFTNTSTTVPVSVSWNFGDGTVSTAVSPAHVYKSAGKYMVEMTADFGTCIGTTRKEIEVQNRPVAAFDASKTDVCQLPKNVTFTNTTTDAASYSWNFGDGQTGTEKNAAHTYTTGGFFDVTLVASSGNGCTDSITKKDAVRVGPPIIKSLSSWLPVSGCVPQIINPVPAIISAEPIVQYKWDFGDGSISSDAKPKHEYNKEGAFTVQLIVITAGGCSDTLTMQRAVTTVKAPVAGFSGAPLDVCAYNAVAFTDTSKGTITNWKWEFGDGSTSDLPNPIHKYTDTGYFTVTLTVTNSGCKDSISKTNYVLIRPPIALFISTMDCAEPFKRSFTDKSIDAHTWHWDFGDGTSAKESSPLHTYKANGTYNVQLVVTNAQCVDTLVKAVKIVDEHPSFSYTLAGEAACRNDVVNFTAADFTGGNISSFSWNFGDNTALTTTPLATISHKYGTAGNAIPQLITTDVLGCKDTITNKVDIKVYGAKAAFANVPGICVNTTAAYTDLSAGDGIHPITKWEWNYGEGATTAYNAGPFSHLYNTPGYYDVKLVVYDNYGCKDSVNKVKALQVTDPAASFGTATPASCTGNKVALTNTSAGESLKYAWSFGDGSAVSTDKSPVHNYSTEGIYDVQLIVTDKYSCYDTSAKNGFITVSNPKASFRIDGPTEATCPPLIVKPINTSTSFSSLSWSFGDGGIAAITDPTHVYTQGGTFDLRLVAKGFGECYDTAHQPIKLKGPSGTFTYDPLKGCNPSTVTFNAVTKNATKVIWDYSDGNVDVGLTASKQHTYKAYGQYIPKLVITDNEGCQVGIENPDTIYVSGIKPAYIFSSQTACDSSAAAFADASTPYWDAVKSYQWTFGDGTVSTGKNPTHFYKKSGTYNTMLTVKTNFGCTDSLAQPVNITVHESPVVSITAPDSICMAAQVELQGNNAQAEAATWQWAVNKNTAVGTTQNITYRFTEAGSFVLTSAATTSFGCTDTASHTLYVIAAPAINAGPDTFVCKGSTALLTATGANNYAWSSKATMSCVSCTATMVNPSESAQYVVSGNNGFGCFASDTVNVSVIEPVVIATQNDTLCLGENATLQVSGAKLYNWSPAIYLNDAVSGAPVFHAAKDTAITYEVTGTDDKKCFSDTKSLTVKVYPVPHMEIMNEDDISLNVGSSVQLMMKSSPDVTQWRWSPATFLSDATIANPIATPMQSVTYTCVASNNGSCFARDQISVNVMCNQANMFIPNTFSPNKDGMNEMFYPRGKGVFNIKSMRIFNRWGQVVFQKNNFLPNVKSDGWDGTFKGQPLSSDVYVYMVEITCDNNTVVPFKGNVTLLR